MTPAKSVSVNLTSEPVNTVKSGGTVTYTATVSVPKGTAKNVKVKLTSNPQAKLAWTSPAASGDTVSLGDVEAGNAESAVAKLSAPTVSKNTTITVAAEVAGTGAGDTELGDTSSHAVTVQKKATAKPTPTKSATPTPTKTKTAKPTPSRPRSPKPTPSHRKPTPTKSSHAGNHHSSHPSSTPTGNGHVPYPHGLPTGLPNNLPSGLPTTGLDVPTGKQSPLPLGNDPTSTGVPALPTVAPSPEGSARTPNVADPQKKASGLVHGDAVSVPAAAAAAFIGLGAGTIITRAVRRRGLWHPVGRHRE